MAGGSKGPSRRKTTLEGEGFPPPDFEGFSPAALQFFRDLACNQNKAWMAEHKALYENVVKAPMTSLVVALSDRFIEEGFPLRGDPARSIFRLNRDIRFSKNKAPYNTHASFALTRDGDKHAPGVLYVHLDPAGSFAAAGFFRPEPDILQHMRQRLVERPSAWAKIDEALGEAGLALDGADTLTRFPKGFETPPGHVAAAVKLKSWITRRDLDATQIERADLVDMLVGFALAAAPVLEFGWSALDARPPSIEGRPSAQRRH